MAANAAKSIALYSYDELYELLYHLKQCNENAPEEMRLLLQENPEFTRAIAQAQLKIGLVHVSNKSVGKERKKHEETESQVSSQQTNVANEFMDELDHEQQQLLEQIQNLAPEVIQSLPAQERRQIMELREAMGLPPM